MTACQQVAKGRRTGRYVRCRSADSEIHALLAPLHHADTADRVVAERALTSA